MLYFAILNRTREVRGKTCVETVGEFGWSGRIKPSLMNRERSLKSYRWAMTPPSVGKQKRHYNAVKLSSELFLITHRSASTESASRMDYFSMLINAMPICLALIHQRRSLGLNTS